MRPHTEIGRTNLTDYKLFGTSQTKFSLYTQAVFNDKHLAYWKLDLGCPQTILKSLQMVLRLILSAFPCNISCIQQKTSFSICHERTGATLGNQDHRTELNATLELRRGYRNSLRGMRDFEKGKILQKGKKREIFY